MGLYVSVRGDVAAAVACKIKDRTRKGLASALPGSGPKLVEDADALVLQETLTRFGLNSHHQRDLEVKGQKGRLRLTRLPAITRLHVLYSTCI